MKRNIVILVWCISLVLIVGGAFWLGRNFFFTVKSDYIGQVAFPKGDSIEITSVKRTKTQMVVKGRYNLISADNALLALYITSIGRGPASADVAPNQQKNITKGQGNFELTHPHLYAGLPHVTMYSTDGKPFASVYFGTQNEARKERQLDLH